MECRKGSNTLDILREYNSYITSIANSYSGRTMPYVIGLEQLFGLLLLVAVLLVVVLLLFFNGSG